MRAWLTVWLPKTGFAAVLVACFGVPIVFTRQTAEAFMVPKVTLLWLCLIVVALGLAVWCIAARRWPVPRTLAHLPLGALLAWTAIATLTSTSPVLSFIGRYGRYDGFLGVAAGALVVVAVVWSTWRRPDRLGWIVGAQLGAAVVCLGYVAIQQFGWDWITWLNESLVPIERPYGLLGNSNFSGAHLALCVPLALGTAARAPQRWQRAACWAFAAMLGLGVWWTGTRGGLLALAAGVAACGFLVPRTVPRLVRWGALAATVAGLTLVVATSLGADAGPIRGQVVGSSGGPRVLSADTLLDRREIWSAGLRMAADHPLVGVGPDAFGLHMAEYRNPTVVASLPLNADEAHDIFIDRLATAGLPALAAYAWLLVLVVGATWRARRTVAEEHAWLLASFGGALGGYLVQGLFSIDVVPLALTAWVSIGALVVLADPRVRAARAAEGTVVLQPVPLAATTAIVAAACILAIAAIHPFAADLRFRDGLLDNAEGRPGLAGVADFHAATTWNRFEPEYHDRLGQQLVAVAATGTSDRALRERFLREAVVAYDHALEHGPGDARSLRLKASALALLGDVDRAHRDKLLDHAQQIYDDLVRRIPSDPVIQIERGRVLELLARDDGPDAADRRAEADRAFRRALALDPTAVAALAGRARLAQAEGDLGAAERHLRRALRLRPGDAELERQLRAVRAERAGASTS